MNMKMNNKEMLTGYVYMFIDLENKLMGFLVLPIFNHVIMDGHYNWYSPQLKYWMLILYDTIGDGQTKHPTVYSHARIVVCFHLNSMIH